MNDERRWLHHIDPPRPFAPTKQWEQFLKSLRAMPQNDPQVRSALRRARLGLAWAKQREQTFPPELLEKLDNQPSYWNDQQKSQLSQSQPSKTQTKGTNTSSQERSA